MHLLYTFGELHLLLLAFTAIVVLYADYKGLLYMWGKHAVLSPRFVFWSHRFVWIGLIGMILTGAALTAPSWEYRLTQGAFYIKMSMVLVLVINACAIGSFSKVATHTPFTDLEKDQKLQLLVSGTLSVIGWIGSAVIGFFFL